MAYTAEKRIENGNPVLYVDGKKCTPMIYALSDLPASNPLTAQAQKNIANFARQGIHLVNTDVSLYKGWHKKGEYDASFLQGDLHAIVSVNPEAHIILRLHVNAPYWWMRDHPEELCIFAKGDVPYVDCGEYERLIKGDEDNDMRVSLASELWLHDAGEQVRALLGAVMDTEDGSHIVGIQIAGGVYGEWHQWGFAYEPDYGACMTAYFRRYLREIYPDEDALRCAWNAPTASFDTAVPAPPALRGHTEPGGYRHPAKDRYVIDSLTAQMRCAPDAILYFARLIRECVTRPILIGTFYGYYDSWDSTYLSGHLDVKRLAESGAVDYFSAPFRYDRGMRGVHGVTEARGLLESARLNGLLWLTEMDNPPIGSTEHIGGDPARLSENIAILRKNVLQPLTRGMGMWYFDHRLVLDLGFGCSIYRKNGWWDHPALLREVRLLKKIGDFCTETPYTPTADVLLVFDTDSRYYSLAHDSFSYGTEPAFFNALGKSGAEYDSIYLHDIEKAELSRYRMVIFVNTCRITNEKRDLIQDKLMGEGRHLMFLNADGYLDNDSRDTDNIGALTGISVKAVDIPNSAVTCGGSLPTAEIKPGWENSVNFAVTDDAAEPVAYFAECDAAAGAKKSFDTHTVWYFSTFPADATVLRAIFKSAGVHIYTECDKAFYAGNGIFMLTADEELDISVRLKNGFVINDHLDAMTTAIYASETGERLDIRYQDQKMEE